MAIRKIAHKGRIEKTKMINIINFVTRSYRDILLREPDPSGLDTYSSLIYYEKMTKDAFLERLIKSNEYNNRFKGTEDIINLESIKEKYRIEENEQNERLESTEDIINLESGMSEKERDISEKNRLNVSTLVIEKSNRELIDALTRNERDKIVFISTWDVNCGIAIYTKDLFESLDKLRPDLFAVRNVNLSYNKGCRSTGSKLVELQHEFGIMSNPPEISGKVIIMWHTIPRDIDKTIKLFESKLNVVAHIVPCEGALKFLKSSKDVYVVNLGSRLMPNIKKEDARQLLDFDKLGIKNKKIGFVFGFQSKNKDYQSLLVAAKNTGLHLLISGSIHQCGYNSNVASNKDVTVIGRYLSDAEIDLYALASDILLFYYVKQDHYSSSSALHRIVGAGRPVICCNTNHFNDIREDIDGALIFGDQKGLENCIVKVLSDNDEYNRLGRLVLEYAKRTSRKEMAKKRLKIYSKYVDIRGSVATAWEMLRV